MKESCLCDCAYEAKRSGNDFTFERNYTGQRLDDTGLLYYGARYYDPAAGRFISPDTLIPDPSDPLDYNRYLYARGNPLKYNDPTGHWIESALDVAFIGYDLYDIRQNGLTWGNGLALAADIGGLLLPVVTGGGLAVQAIVHGDDAAKMLRAASRADALDDAVRAGRLAQNAFDGVRVGDKVVDTSSLLVQHFEQAAAYGIGTYDQLKAATAGTGLTVHHVVEKRFARNLSIADEGDMLSVVLTREEHQVFTNAWRSEIGYNRIDKGVITYDWT